MPFLDDQLPKALLDAVNAGVDVDGGSAVDQGGGGNATSIGGQGNDIFESVASQFPLTGLWPLAILLALSALAILSILLKLAWSLARAKLCFFRKYKIHYSAPSNLTSPIGFAWEDTIHNGEGKTRSLILPAEGIILVCALLTCVAGIAAAIGIENNGRLAWMGSMSAAARTVEFLSIWLMVLFMLTSSVCFVPLFSSRTSPAHFLDLSEQTTPFLPRALAKPIMHPLLVNSLVFIFPVLLGTLPDLASLAETLKSVSFLQDIVSGPARSSGGIEDAISSLFSRNNTLQANEGALGTIASGVDGVLRNWQVERAVRGASVAALLVLLVFIEYKAQKRLSTAAGYLEEVEQASINQSMATRQFATHEEKEPSVFQLMIDSEEQDTFTGRPSSGIARYPSLQSASSRGLRTPSLYNEGPRRPQSSLSRSQADRSPRPTSRASSYRSFSASLSKEAAVLYVPELPEMDLQLPSPSLLRDELGASTRGEAASPYSPALALFEQKLDRSLGASCKSQTDRLPVTGRRLSLHRVSSMLSDTSTLRCSERGCPARRPFSLDVPPVAEHKIAVEDDYFGDSKLPYDDGYEAQLGELEYGPAIAHMLSPSTGTDESASDGLYMKRDGTQRSHLSRSYTPGLSALPPRPSPALSGAPSSRSSRRPQSRASSYSYRTHRSSSSSFSYASSRTAASWRSRLLKQETYQGPNAMHLVALKKSRAVDAALLATCVLFQGLLEWTCAIAAVTILNSKTLQASVSFASMLLKVLPILGGVILSSIRSSSPAYGWHSRHVLVAATQEEVMDDRVSRYTASVYEKGI